MNISGGYIDKDDVGVSTILRFKHESNIQTWIHHGNLSKKRYDHAIGVVKSKHILPWCEGENGTIILKIERVPRKRCSNLFSPRRKNLKKSRKT